MPGRKTKRGDVANRKEVVSAVILALGSNLGDRLGNCKKAIELLKKNPEIESVGHSKWYETKAHTVREDETQPDYINGIVKIKTSLKPLELLKFAKKIERALGRRRETKKWAPRPIDIDIISYDSMILDTKELKIPHPEAHKRIFVLRPLCDIDPAWMHPLLKVSAEGLLRALENRM